MYYCQINVPLGLKEQFKIVCVQIGAKYDFDMKQKRWEARLQNNKATNKNIQQLKDFCEQHDLTMHDWYAKDNQYKETVYYKKRRNL